MDLAWSQVSSGAFDAGSAIRQAVKKLCQQGVEAVEYPSGKVDTVETAVRRAVLTGVNQTAAKLQEELADEVGCDLVEVSAHAGARPEHAEWQGKIYSRSGKSEKYPDFRSSTGYGTGAGLCGWNCRHTFSPYIEGSPRVWTDEKLAELSAPKYEYQGEQFTEYEAQQKEKYFDRQITRWRREAEAMKAAGQDPAEARAKVKTWERRKSDFVLNRAKLTVEKSQNDGIIISGAISGALDPDSDRAQIHAKQYYESVRHMKNDCERIAQNTGFSKQEIETVKRYVFLEKHDLGGEEEELFFPSYEMAESWRRLIDGKEIQNHDITLLKHELMERGLVEKGLSQDEAHRITSKKYNYGREAEAYYGIHKRNPKE